MVSCNLGTMILLNMWYSNYNDVIDMNEKIANELGLTASCGLYKTAYQSLQCEVWVIRKTRQAVQM